MAARALDDTQDGVGDGDGTGGAGLGLGGAGLGLALGAGLGLAFGAGLGLATLDLGEGVGARRPRPDSSRNWLLVTCSTCPSARILSSSAAVACGVDPSGALNATPFQPPTASLATNVRLTSGWAPCRALQGQTREDR